MPIALLLALVAIQDAPAAPARAQDAARAGAPAGATAPPQRWSILADPCAGARDANERILVCGAEEASARLPLPEERGPPDRPVPGNPERSGSRALALTTAPCATEAGGCPTGMDIFGAGTFVVRAVGKIIDGNSCCETPGEATSIIGLINDAGAVIKRSFAKKPDKSRRVPIPLDDPAGEATDAR